jgi:AraC family transcriptional regulator of adaptative response / DNA-3-methyladenine glycosylase II
MNLEADTCYQALSARDRRFDGIFFVAVSSTKIYCRPICTVRLPMQKNCTFFANAAACENAGYRPCLRCRPELAPGNSSVDATSTLVARAVSYIDDGALADESLENLSDKLGVTSRHLRRVFETELGVTPVQFVQTKRLLIAKHLLTDTDIPVTQIAMASGFSSVRRFNSLFLERYKLNPSQLRKTSTTRNSTPDSFTAQLSFRPPYDWNAMLAYLQTRGCAGVELVENGRYHRTVLIDKVSGWLSVAMNEANSTLAVTMSSSLAPKFMQILARVKRLFDLQANPHTISNALGGLADDSPGLRVPGAFDSFEIAIRAILGQQVSVKAATSLAGRIALKYGGEIVTPYPKLNLHSAQASSLATASEADLAALGIMPARARTIINFAREWLNGEINLAPGADYEATVAQLVSLPGIGEWTANYIAMRCLAWPDAFMHGDLGVQKALGHKNKKTLIELTETYRPWRAYATMHLWKSLEGKVS